MAGKETLFREADDEAREICAGLIGEAMFGALGVLGPDTGLPFVSRIAVGRAPDGGLISLISDLSQHTAALRATPGCSLMLGEPGPKGDPLTHPRVTLQCEAMIVPHRDPGYRPLRDHYLLDHPKSRLYIDFADFVFVRLSVEKGFLNGGFGYACMLTSSDLGFGA